MVEAGGRKKKARGSEQNIDCSVYRFNAHLPPLSAGSPARFSQSAEALKGSFLFAHHQLRFGEFK